VLHASRSLFLMQSPEAYKSYCLFSTLFLVTESQSPNWGWDLSRNSPVTRNWMLANSAWCFGVFTTTRKVYLFKNSLGQLSVHDK
jgi:hypothetical protein